MHDSTRFPGGVPSDPATVWTRGSADRRTTAADLNGGGGWFPVSGRAGDWSLPGSPEPPGKRQ